MRKKILGFVACIILSVAITTVITSCDKKVETIQIKYVNATTLNVRSGPDTTYEIVETKANEKTSSSEEDTEYSNIEMSVVDKKNNMSVLLFTDPQTNKQYLIFKDVNGGIAVTPRE